MARPLSDVLKQFFPSLIGGILVVTLDQTLKAWLAPALEAQPGGQVWLIEPVLKLRLVHNSGFVFGMLSGTAAPWVVTVVVLVAIGALFYVYARQIQSPTIFTRMVFGLTLGGAVGNLIDRFRMGYVIDYVDLGWWPVFNVADAAINISILIFVILLLAGRVEKRPDVPSPFMG